MTIFYNNKYLKKCPQIPFLKTSHLDSIAMGHQNLIFSYKSCIEINLGSTLLDSNIIRSLIGVVLEITISTF